MTHPEVGVSDVPAPIPPIWAESTFGSARPNVSRSAAAAERPLLLKLDVGVDFYAQLDFGIGVFGDGGVATGS